MTLLVILLPSMVLGRALEPGNCPTLNLHCYKKQENRLVEIPLGKWGDEYDTKAKKVGWSWLCQTEDVALDFTGGWGLFRNGIYRCKQNYGADFFSIGEKPYMTYGEAFPQKYKYLPGFANLPGFKDLPAYKVRYKKGKNLPEPGDIISSYALFWHFGIGKPNSYQERIRESFKKGDASCPKYELVCSNNRKRPKKEDFYTGILYPGCSKGLMKKCKVCSSLKKIGLDFCRDTTTQKWSGFKFDKPSYQFAHFVPKGKSKELLKKELLKEK